MIILVLILKLNFHEPYQHILNLGFVFVFFCDRNNYNTVNYSITARHEVYNVNVTFN